MKKRNPIIIILLVLAMSGLSFAKEKKIKHPFDLFDSDMHAMHNDFFESANISCDLCHKDPENPGNRAKINKMGCHTCHNNPDPPAPGTQDCNVCHIGGKFPKPQSHKAGWMAKHQDYAKQNAEACTQCHKNQMFCINCHQRRDSIQQIMHRRNFMMYHSIEARANPRKCDECHTLTYCQNCHSGKGNEKE